jgi:hypothetical protein
MITLKTERHEYGYKESDEGLGHTLLLLDNHIPHPVDCWVLDYKGEDEEEILSELYLRYVDTYKYKGNTITSKDWLNAYNIKD